MMTEIKKDKKLVNSFQINFDTQCLPIRGMFSTSGGCSVHQGDIMSTLRDVQYIGVFNKNQKSFMNLLSHMNHDIPPMY